MIQHVLNISNDKRNEMIAKIRREKLEFRTRRHSIEFEIAKTKITHIDLNNYDCHVF